MNEKKAIVFFFFFFCFVVFSFFFYFLVVVPSTYVTYTSFSRRFFVLFVSVCSSSPSCARSPASVLLARPMCVCVSFNFHFLLLLFFFRGPLTVFQTLLLPFLRALGFFFFALTL